MSVPSAVCAAVDERAGDHCEACGFTIPTGDGVRHHRKAKGIGGRRTLDTVENLIRIHHRCHAWIHANPAVARHYGWIVRDHLNPAEISVRVEASLSAWAA
jgi:hypothetical protein